MAGGRRGTEHGRTPPSHRWWQGWWHRWWFQTGLIVALYELYGWARSRLEGPRDIALDNALEMIRVERALNAFFEEAVQEWFLRWPDVVRFWNVFYGTVHFAVPVITFVLLWRRDRQRFAFWRTVFLVMLAAALAGFALYPLMPPRLLPPPFDFADTARLLGPFSEDPEDAANLYAAMPSMHIGWGAWAAFALVPILRSWWGKAVAVAYPFVMLLATVVTGNHYWIDGVGGVAAMGVGVAVAWGWARARARRARRAADARERTAARGARIRSRTSA